ncbi:MAG: hypothetical protein HY040_01575 [Planctomycetes bacterium]|nr:hypothetical protein [Planctomycetota bacterium]
MNVHELQAPTEDGGVLAAPPLLELGAILEQNRRILSTSNLEILGRPLTELRSEARAAVLAAARSYHVAADEPVPESLDVGLLVAGHQPEIFHPGVWLKNFALNALARRHGRMPLNLVVDNDTAKNALVRVPVDDHLIGVPFDHWQGEVPYEERPVLDEDAFSQFPNEVSRHAGRWPFAPMLSDFWAEVRRQSQRTPLLGERIAAARRSLERRWGCHNFELPLSRLCVTAPFAWFACHLLENLPRFHALYNATVEAYRNRYGLRSRNHPVPDLAKKGDWFEMPLWSWRTGRTRRQRLFARADADSFHLHSGSDEWPILRRSGAVGELIAQYLSLEKQGYKIRTRALTLTLFARLFLADTFMHGLGGGKYDELTDNIIQGFFGIEPPAFLVLTGTLRLPFEPTRVSREMEKQLARQARDIVWNPQRHLDDSNPQVAQLKAEKQQWIL